MLNKSLKVQYEKVPLSSDISALMAAMIAGDELTARALSEIAKRDKVIINNKGKTLDVYGVTKEELRKSLYLGERKATTGKNKGKIVAGYPAIKTIDTIIGFLEGTTIVYCEKHANKEKRYSLTWRAMPIIKILCDQGCLDRNELFGKK